jgi:hypothetical protein
MPRFMDYHPELNLPQDAIDQLADDAREGKKDDFGVSQVELFHDHEGHVYCLLDAPDAEAVRKHHEALGIEVGDVHEVESLA